MKEKLCLDCGFLRPLEDFVRHAGKPFGVGTYCKQHHSNRINSWNKANREKVKAYEKENPNRKGAYRYRQRPLRQTLLYGARAKAQKYGRDFSLDRVDNARGYCKDNIGYLCNRCNAFKGARSLEQLWEFVKENPDSIYGKLGLYALKKLGRRV